MGLFSCTGYMAATFSYGKEEKLKSRKLLDQLFQQGKTFSIFPLKVFYMLPAEALDFPVKTGVGASSRHFKKAVDRNRIKRILREAYRTEKLPLHDFLNMQNKQVAIFILYIDKVLPEYEKIKTTMPLVLEKLIKKLHENAAANT